MSKISRENRGNAQTGRNCTSNGSDGTISARDRSVTQHSIPHRIEISNRVITFSVQSKHKRTIARGDAREDEYSEDVSPEAARELDTSPVLPFSAAACSEFTALTARIFHPRHPRSPRRPLLTRD